MTELMGERGADRKSECLGGASRDPSGGCRDDSPQMSSDPRWCAEYLTLHGSPPDGHECEGVPAPVRAYRTPELFLRQGNKLTEPHCNGPSRSGDVPLTVPGDRPGALEDGIPRATAAPGQRGVMRGYQRKLTGSRLVRLPGPEDQGTVTRKTA